jgi:heme/copper-type cytochrome/quinol oxidase subunit 3
VVVQYDPLEHELLRFALLHHVGPARIARLHRADRHDLLAGKDAVSYYWHFVDIVWVGLYSCLFLLK